MEQRPEDPSDKPITRALATVRTAAYVLRDLDFAALDELDQDAVSEWEASLGNARATLLRVLAQRGCEELEVPPRGQLDRFDEARVKHHVQGISKALLAEFERIDATPGSLGKISTSIVLGLLYSLRSIEQFIRWQDPLGRLRSRVREASREGTEPPQAPAVPRMDAEALQESPDLEPAAEAALPSVPTPSAAPLPPPPTRRRDVDLSGFYERPDEYGGALRMPPLSVFHGCARGPELAQREQCLDATCVRAVAGGVAFALADGADSSVGARVASAIATTTFCQLLALATEPPGDVRGAVLSAAEGARRHLESLLESLIDSADDSDAITRLRGALPVRTVRRILEHTLRPDPNLRHVTPALAVSLVAGVVLRSPRETLELTLLSVGGSVVERKQRGQSTEVLLPVEGVSARFAPGGVMPWQPTSVPLCGPIELKPGDIVVVGSPALRRGYYGSAFEGLSLLCPDILQLSSPHDEHALQLLRQAGAAADRYEALEERRIRSQADPLRPDVWRRRLFAGDLSMVLLTLAARVRSSTIAEARPDQVTPESPLRRRV
jgi:hypothetical protein